VRGSTAKKIRELIGYHPKQDNFILKKLYNTLKRRYNTLGPLKFWKSMEGKFKNQ